MNTVRLFAIAPLALSTVACTTEQAVDGSIRVTLDLTVQDVDLNCITNVTDDLDKKTNERVTGSVLAIRSGDCRLYAHYRAPVLNFDDLRDDLPDGVDEVIWTSVDVELERITPTVENVTALPVGTDFWLGLAATSEDGIDAFETFDDPNGKYNNDWAGLNVLRATKASTTGTLLHVQDFDIPAALPLDDLVDSLITNSTTTTDPAVIADIFNDAFESGASDLYVIGGSYLAIPLDQLPKAPSDVSLEVEALISYQASAKVNLLQVAQSANQ